MTMKPIVEKILKSGLVDKHMAQMMEHWGNLPSGASELIPEDEDHLKKATKEQLDALVEDIGDEVAKLQAIKETQLDLDRIRWPVEVDQIATNTGEALARTLKAVVDRMGRLYFRIQDVKEEWFVPGFVLHRQDNDKENVGHLLLIQEEILESTVLYTGDSKVCVQVTVRKLA